MISYELAKKLKEAGFPQTEIVSPVFYPEKGKGYNPDNYNNTRDMVIKIPSLSELIEACGDDFSKLIRQYNPDLPDERSTWWKACSHKIEPSDCDYEDYGYISVKAPTPEEAVANLWIRLNKNCITKNHGKGCLRTHE